MSPSFWEKNSTFLLLFFNVLLFIPTPRFKILKKKKGTHFYSFSTFLSLLLVFSDFPQGRFPFKGKKKTGNIPSISFPLF
jgi:hypothetical protein